jgi:hypothetical protein
VKWNGIEVGDTLIGQNGNKWKVLGVFPNGDFAGWYLDPAVADGIVVTEAYVARISPDFVTLYHEPK